MIDELGILITPTYLDSKGLESVLKDEWIIKDLTVEFKKDFINVYLGQDWGQRTYMHIQYEHELDTLLTFLNYEL
jgi:hypothetical protein